MHGESSAASAAAGQAVKLRTAASRVCALSHQRPRDGTTAARRIQNSRGAARKGTDDPARGERLVGGVEVVRLDRWLEWAIDDPRRIGAQMKCVPVEERALRPRPSV